MRACPDQQATLDTINDLRARHDLAPLEWDAGIEEELRTRLSDNAELVCGNPGAIGQGLLFDFFPSMRLYFSQRAQVCECGGRAVGSGLSLRSQGK